MKKILGIIICAVLLCGTLACCSNGGSSDASGDSSSSAVETTSVNDDVEVFVIKAVEWEFKYPKEYEKSVKTDVKEENGGTTVTFSSDNKKLFDLQLNCGSGDVLGTLTKDGKNTIVRVSYEKLDKNDKNYSKYYAMQGAVDAIITNLKKDYDFKEGEENYVNSQDVYEIPTKVVSLYYPKQWQGVVKTAEADDSVVFSYGDTKLFEIVFKESPGATILGSYNGTPVGIISPNLEKGKLTDHEYTTILAMQESVDTIIQNLEKQDGFKAK